MPVSVIVLNYNDSELTAEYVRKIQTFNVVDRIIVVDNASPDGSYRRLQQLVSDKVDVISTEKNNGYASGNNFGLRWLFEHYGAEGYVIVSNPDISVSEECIQKILASFENQPYQFAATGEVYDLAGNRIPLYTWRLPTAAILFTESSVLLRTFLRKAFHYSRRYMQSETTPLNGRIEGDVLPGCFFMADAKKMLQIGMFDENTFLYYEEEILFSKAKKNGFVSCVVPGASLVHAEGVSTRKSIHSWAKRERIMEDSCVCYQRTCLHKNEMYLRVYRIWNRIMLPERYLLCVVKRIIRKKG